MTNATRSTYSAHGFRLSVSLDSGIGARTTDQTIRYHGFLPVVPDETGTDLDILIGENRACTVPETAEHVLTHPSGVELKRAGDSIFLVRGDAAMRVDAAAGSAEARMPSGIRDEDSFSVDSTLYLFLTFGLVLLLQARDLFVLHAAALTPGGAGGMLLVAPSGSGKSTLALRLIDSGWKFVSDDSILVTETDEGVIAYPFRRDATVFTDTIAQYPAAAAHSVPLFSDPSKVLVDMDSAYPGSRLESLQPTVLVFPSITGEDSTRLDAMKPAAAMVDLISQASFLAADSPRIAKLMNVMKRLVEQTRHVQLRAGTDLRDDPDRADTLLSELV